MKILRQHLLGLTFSIINIPGFIIIAVISRLWKSVRVHKEFNVVWGTDPILNNHHWSQAVKSKFTQSIFISREDSFILDGRADVMLFFDRKGKSFFFKVIKTLLDNFIFSLTFIKVLFRANLVCISCDGFIFQYYKSPGFNYKIEFFLLRLAKVAICVFPYGADAYVYSKVHDKNWLYGMLLDYPAASKRQKQIEKRVGFYVKKSNFFFPGQMLFDGIGRSDWITPSTLCVGELPERRKKKTVRRQLVVTHAPNHREVKGTKFILNAVDQLISEGVAIELKLLERKSNHEILRVLAEDSDVHIDQLFFDGYAMNALEAMSIGVPTIGNFSGPVREFFDRWSFTSECPMIIANENTLLEVLRNLCDNDDYLEAVSLKSAAYVRKYHSYNSFSENFSEIIQASSSEYREWLLKN